MIRILVDSSSDYTLEEIKEKGLDFVPIHINIGDQNYADVLELDRDHFYELLTKGKDFPTTSQPSPQDFLNVFQDAREKGDEVICILLSSALSGTCQSAHLAKSMAEYDGIYIVDSLAATHLIRIMADQAFALRSMGYTACEIAEQLHALRPRIRVAAALETLTYLSRGGRISKTTAAIGDAANLKPVITVTQEGTVGIIGKCLGRNKAVSFLLKQLSEAAPDPAFPLYTLYTYGTQNCDRLEEKLSAAGYSTTARLQIGSTIGTHVGPEAFGIIYVTKA